MISNRDGHVRVLPLLVANKIAAGEVVERPASVVKELVENAIDAGARRIAITITQGGRKLIAVQDDGCGMTKDDAVLSLERQATSKIHDVTDIEEIDTLGFRGEAIPSIASVSRFTLTTRRADSDEGTTIQVNAGTLAEVRSAGCPPGTRVEVRDLFCNVPARRKFLRAYATEEGHVKQIFTIHALAHPPIAFSLTIDGRELYKLAPAANLSDRVHDLFGDEFLQSAQRIEGRKTEDGKSNAIRVSGFIEKPNLSTPTRRDQYVFVNGRPATSASIAYALREAYPRRAGDSRPAAIIFIDLPPNQVDVNVHPTKREVRFRDNGAVKNAIMEAIARSVGCLESPSSRDLRMNACASLARTFPNSPLLSDAEVAPFSKGPLREAPPYAEGMTGGSSLPPARKRAAQQALAGCEGGAMRSVAEAPEEKLPAASPEPVPMEFAIEPDSTRSKPWQWFKFLAQSASGYLLVETDSGIVTINPHAACERIAYEKLLDSSKSAGETPPPQKTSSLRGAGVSPAQNVSQTLLIPETVQLSPADAARIKTALPVIAAMGFQLEEFGRDTFKIDAIPQLIGSLSPAAILSTIAADLAEGGAKRGERWREELIAKSIAKSFAGASLALTEDGAVKLIEEPCACRMPYVCPRGKPVMIFTSTRELDRKFDRH